MATSINTLIAQMLADGSVERIANNPLAQFGMGARLYRGAELLPERTVPENAFREDAIKYRTVLANAGSRYSPAQKKGSQLVGYFLAELMDSDIASEFTGKEYDALLRILQQKPSMQATVQLLGWLDKTVNLPLVELNEKMRWDAIVDAAVSVSGDNGYSASVTYSNPSGHRASAGGTWSSDSYDLFNDILAMADLLASKGYTVSRIYAPRPVVSIMSGNDKVKARTGVATISSSGQIQATAGRASIDAINSALARDGLPPIQQYDLQYRTQTGTGYFLKRDVFVMVATTGQNETIDLGDSERMLNDTLGYMAIGRGVGQANPGRVIRSEAFMDKPPRIKGEGWQTSLPIITEPEAIAVIHTIT